MDSTADEICDDGNILSGDGCSADCRSTEACDNGYTDIDTEERDEGDDETDSCIEGCQRAFCGDGYFHAGFEECDDGNNVSGGGCASDCQFEP